MSRTHATLLGLLLLQIVLIVIFRSPFSGPALRTETRPLLPELESLTPTRLQIDGADDQRITLLRQGDDWTIEEIGGFPADADKIGRLLENLAGVQVRRPVVSNKSYHDAFKVASGNHVARLQVWGSDDDDPRVELILGSSANYRTTHARRGSEDEVYEIQGIAPYDLQPAHSSWIRKELADGVGEVDRLSLHNSSGRFELERQDGLWSVVSPADRGDEALDQEAVLALLRAATELRLADAVGPLDETLHGFTAPAATLKLAWSSGRPGAEDGGPGEWTLRIGGKPAEQDAQRYVTCSDSGFTGTIWETSLERLLDDSLEDLRAKQVTGSSPAELQLSQEILSAANVIQPSNLLESVSYLASDRLEGRGPGTRGDVLAREYLARRLREIGYEPAFEGDTWEQPFKIVGVESRMPESWTFQATDGDGEVAFRFREEYMGASGVQRPSVTIDDAEVVFVGYGIQAAEEDWDDFKGSDLRGKVLLMLNDDPDQDPALFAGERKLYYGRWTYKFESAARQGAAAAIIIHTTSSAGYPWQVVRTSWSGEQFKLEAGDEPHTPLEAWLTEDAATRLAALGGHDLSDLVERARSREFRPVSLGVTTSLSFSVKLRETATANVAGILRGSDDDVADQVLIYSAHHDHLGLGEPDESGDTIYNGALDNSVAMAQALSIAEAFGSLEQAPRRSVMILFPAAEEQGLLGSKHFAESGALHPGKMVADINLELGNVWGRTRDVVVFGQGKSTLEDLLVLAARRQQRSVTAEGDLRAGWYYRSDQFSLARVGVPSIWFRSGTDYIGRPEGWGEEQFSDWIRRYYHQPIDEVSDDWNLDGLVEDARLAFYLGAAVADTDRLPEWYPGDEFEDERKSALQAVGITSRERDRPAYPVTAAREPRRSD